MKKYLPLIAIVFFINTATAQEKNLDPKFIYEKLVDIYHKSSSVDEKYFSEIGFGLISTDSSPNGDIIQRAMYDAEANHFKLTQDDIFNGPKEFTVTTHRLSTNLYSTIESRYCTRSRKEYKNCLEYIKNMGYKLVGDKSTSTDTQTYQLEKVQIMLQKVNHNGRPYQIIYSINTN